MPNAINGKKYDFKMTNGQKEVIYNEPIKYYRGVRFDQKPIGEMTIASARDIGNYIAGYEAGVNGISWPMARIAFDGLQSIKSERLDHEPKGTQIAQLKGWIHGTLSFGRLTYNLLIPLH